jgi:hypothetical protein
LKEIPVSYSYIFLFFSFVAECVDPVSRLLVILYVIITFLYSVGNVFIVHVCFNARHAYCYRGKNLQRWGGGGGAWQQKNQKCKKQNQTGIPKGV